ncbi:hypothetical protein LOAG_01281 [Loa loa]|uniref:SET domain-containing protein n=1 Tax=Loa loa TaxID=7209 RepID=A0A1I7VSE2_LOALO|nr:hypothetical protein LOAG_01281 [Loa loa]EFO27194.1 hypothetical protein LOAG_01281 [Loa loa]
MVVELIRLHESDHSAINSCHSQCTANRFRVIAVDIVEVGDHLLPVDLSKEYGGR